MNVNNNANKVQHLNQPDQLAMILHEQIALRRLKWLELQRLRKLLWNLVLRIVEPVRLVREVGPNHPPLERHEWERGERLNIR